MDFGQVSLPACGPSSSSRWPPARATACCRPLASRAACSRFRCATRGRGWRCSGRTATTASSPASSRRATWSSPRWPGRSRASSPRATRGGPGPLRADRTTSARCSSLGATSTGAPLPASCTARIPAGAGTAPRWCRPTTTSMRWRWARAASSSPLAGASSTSPPTARAPGSPSDCRFRRSRRGGRATSCPTSCGRRSSTSRCAPSRRRSCCRASRRCSSTAPTRRFRR